LNKFVYKDNSICELLNFRACYADTRTRVVVKTQTGDQNISLTYSVASINLTSRISGSNNHPQVGCFDRYGHQEL